MLDSDTKRRINTCRDILVGKVPDPKSQVEQITIAHIYKFMDDMDLESEQMGGARKFFTGDFERYAWAKLVAPGVGGQDMLNTYSEALARMPENASLPPLFRDIFRHAFQIGRANVCTPVTNAHIVCRLMCKKKHTNNTK